MKALFGRLAIAAIVSIILWLAWVVVVPVRLPHAHYNIIVGDKWRLGRVARGLASQDIIRHRLVMIALARLAGIDRKLKAGIYPLRSPASMLDILQRFAAGNPEQAIVVLVEGWTFRQFRQALAKSAYLQPITAKWSESQILAAIDANSCHAEGLMFPSTYFFTPESADLLIFKRAFVTMQQKLAAIWTTRAADLPYRTPYEMLIMASLIEKETSHAEDRALVAAVFVNRLKNGMRLQADPAVIYGIGEKFDGNLRKLDLARDTPFNTYTRKGLPPTPIAMPSEASLQAAARPAISDALYFVAKGGSGSHFSETLNEHNSAVQKYILKKRR